MKGRIEWLCGVAVLGGLAAAPAGATVVKATMGVSATVVATCRIAPGDARGCAPPAKGEPGAAPAPQPTVTFSVDPKTGTRIETVEF